MTHHPAKPWLDAKLPRSCPRNQKKHQKYMRKTMLHASSLPAYTHCTSTNIAPYEHCTSTNIAHKNERTEKTQVTRIIVFYPCRPSLRIRCDCHPARKENLASSNPNDRRPSKDHPAKKDHLAEGRHHLALGLRMITLQRGITLLRHSRHPHEPRKAHTITRRQSSPEC